MGFLNKLINKLITPLSSNQTWKEFLTAVNDTADSRLLYTLHIDESSVLAMWWIDISQMSHYGQSTYFYWLDHGYPEGTYTIVNGDYWELWAEGHQTSFDVPYMGNLYQVGFTKLTGYSYPLVLAWTGKSSGMVDMYFNGLYIKDASYQKSTPISLPFDTDSFHLLHEGFVLKKLSQRLVDMVPYEDSHMEYTFKTKIFSATDDAENPGTSYFFYYPSLVIPYSDNGSFPFGDLVFIGTSATGPYYKVLGQNGGRVFIEGPWAPGETTITLQRWFGGYLPGASFNELTSGEAEIDKMVNSCVPFNALEKNHYYVFSLSATAFSFLSYESGTSGVFDNNIRVLYVLGNDSFTISDDAAWLHIKDTHGNEITEYVGAVALYLTVEGNSTGSDRTASITIESQHSGVFIVSVTQISQTINVSWNILSTSTNRIVWSSTYHPQLIATVDTVLPWRMNLPAQFLKFYGQSGTTAGARNRTWQSVDRSGFPASSWTIQVSNQNGYYETQSTGQGVMKVNANLNTYSDDISFLTDGTDFFVPDSDSSNVASFNRQIEIYALQYPSNKSIAYLTIKRNVGATFQYNYPGGSFQTYNFPDTELTSAVQLVSDTSISASGGIAVTIPDYLTGASSVRSNCSSWTARIININNTSEVVSYTGSGTLFNHSIQLQIPANATSSAKTWEFQFLVGSFKLAYFRIIQSAAGS